MAEISVPAWPIPIHHTRLTIAKPHPTGMLMPQIPVPLTKRYVTAMSSTLTMTNDRKNPSHHPSGARLVRTIELILSVTEPNVWPGAITGGTPVPTMASFGSSMGARLSAILQLGIHVSDRPQIRRPRARIELAEERVVADLGLQLRDAAVRVVQIAEDDRFRRTRLLTRRLNLAVSDPPVLFLRIDPDASDSLHAVGALFHHT